MVRLFPAYVGGKSFWVPKLEEFRGMDFVEPFCGSAAISINLARTALLNDSDEVLCRILSNYPDLEVPEVFTQEDYFRVRGRQDWWRHAFCLQGMSFSGVFRHGKGGYNVPVRKRAPEVRLRDQYLRARSRFIELSPRITCGGYRSIKPSEVKGKVVVLDPPYEGSQASYNHAFDYDSYWRYVRRVMELASVTILFDRESNVLGRLGDVERQCRSMRVNGKHRGDREAMCVVKNS